MGTTLPRGQVVALPGEPGPSLEYRRELPFPWRVIHERYQQGRSRRQGNPRCHHRGCKGRGGIQNLEEAPPSSPPSGAGDYP